MRCREAGENIWGRTGFLLEGLSTLRNQISSPLKLLGLFFIWALVPSAGSDMPMARTQWQEEPLAAADMLPGQLHGIVFTG